MIVCSYQFKSQQQLHLVNNIITAVIIHCNLKAQYLAKYSSYILPNLSPPVQKLHPVLGKVDVEAVEESSQQPSYSTHQHEDNQVVGIPQCAFLLHKGTYINVCC